MGSFSLKKWVKRGQRLCLSLLGIVFSPLIWASSGGTLPFASAMQRLQNEITKAWLPSASIVLFVTTCLMLAFGEYGEGFKKLLNIVMWLSLAFGVASFISIMFGGGAVA